MNSDIEVCIHVGAVQVFERAGKPGMDW